MTIQGLLKPKPYKRFDSVLPPHFHHLNDFHTIVRRDQWLWEHYKHVVINIVRRYNIVRVMWMLKTQLIITKDINVCLLYLAVANVVFIFSKDLGERGRGSTESKSSSWSCSIPSSSHPLSTPPLLPVLLLLADRKWFLDCSLLFADELPLQSTSNCRKVKRY